MLQFATDYLVNRGGSRIYVWRGGRLSAAYAIIEAPGAQGDGTWVRSMGKGRVSLFPWNLSIEIRVCGARAPPQIFFCIFGSRNCGF